MLFAYYIKKNSLIGDARVGQLLESMSDAGHELYQVETPSDVKQGTAALLSLGGDGTFLLGARIAVSADIPILGVNFGRLGFLSEMKPEELVSYLDSGELSIDPRPLLQLSLSGAECEDFWPYAFNEVSVSRVSASMLGVDVVVDGAALPTYWADGLLVATSSGSTAYSLSVGGPICTPDTKVFIIAPVSPHNLNVRPLIVPQSSKISISLRSRDEYAVLTMDNRDYTIPVGAKVDLQLSVKHLKKITSGQSTFIDALRSRLLWGADVRNNKEL